MGGSGSGRRWWFDANETTDDYRSIDVRRWKRWGRLEPGQVFAHRWLRNGEVCGSINVRIEPGRAILDYRHRSGDTEWQQECYPVALNNTLSFGRRAPLVPLPSPRVRSPRRYFIRRRYFCLPPLPPPGISVPTRACHGSRRTESGQNP